jgi:hypothetical protein
MRPDLGQASVKSGVKRHPLAARVAGEPLCGRSRQDALGIADLVTS